MIGTVVDTHALIWYLAGDRRLSDSALQYLSQIIHSGDQIAISVISLIEIVYLAEKGRLAADWPQRVFSLIEKRGTPFTKVAVNLQTVKSASALAGSGITDMPDRIIAATSIQLGVPLVTRDHAIAASTVNTVW